MPCILLNLLSWYGALWPLLLRLYLCFSSSYLNIFDNISASLRLFDLKFYTFTFIIFLSKLINILFTIMFRRLFPIRPWYLRGVLKSIVDFFKFYLVVVEINYI